MSISSRSRASLADLVTSANDLVRHLQDSSDISQADDARSLVSRYLDLVNEGLSKDDAQTALRGANLLTTVNKGLSDAGLTRNQSVTSNLAFTVTRQAIDAARSLRGDLNMAF